MMDHEEFVVAALTIAEQARTPEEREQALYRLLEMAGEHDEAGRRGESRQEQDEDADEVDPEVLAEIFYGLYGDKAVEIVQRLLEQSGQAAQESWPLWEAWDAASHPRGPDGRFIARGSPAAVAAARDVVSRVIGGDRSVEPKELFDHLSILTVQQIRQVAAQH